MVGDNLEDKVGKKQLQIRNLYSFIQAINHNASRDELYSMYEECLGWLMGVRQMMLFIKEGDRWNRVAQIDFEQLQQDDSAVLEAIRRIDPKSLYPVDQPDEGVLRDVRYIIPVLHKKEPLAYVVIGDIQLSPSEDIYEAIEFISMVTNIIVMAVENKRLFKEQLMKEKMRQELLVAERVQRMLIPDRFPDNACISLSSLYIPHSGIGGDYFDYIPFDEDRFVLCMADVSGKGISAALLMANFQALVRTLIRHYRDLGAFIIALNDAVRSITRSERHLTFFVMDVNLKTRQVKYINAGHYPPILWTGKECVDLKEGCTIIGCLEDLGPVREGEFTLEPGYMVLTFTDGLIEIFNADNEMLSDQFLKAIVQQYAHLPPAEFNEKLREKLIEYHGSDRFDDDIAILTMKYNGVCAV